MRSVRARLVDVAKMAGVAPNTASTILNKRPGSWASEETRKRVIEAATKLGYRPNRAALGIRLGRFQAIGLVVPELHNPFYTHFADVLDRALQEKDYFLVIENGRGNTSSYEKCLETILNRHVDGVCYFMGSVKEHLEFIEHANAAGKTTCVLAGTPAEPFPFDAVVTDFAEPMRAVVEHLVSLGHKRFAFLISVFQGQEAGDRPLFFRSFLEEHRIPPENIHFIECGHQLPEVHAAFSAYLDAHPTDRATALMCLDDLAAIGCLRAAAERGIEIPRDLSLVGVNNIPIGDFLPRRLTTIAQPIEEMALAAAELLTRRLAAGQRDCPPVTRYFPSRFIVKESTGSPHAVSLD